MFTYEKFDIVEVAEACGIQMNSRTLGRTEIEAWCPFCPTPSSDYHLYLNRGRERFYCQKCSASGNSVSLYARIQGISNKEAAHRLSAHAAYSTGATQVQAKEERQGLDYVTASLAQRHDVYYDMLTAMALSMAHHKNLMSRGLSSDRIQQNKYRTMPDNMYKRRQIAEFLAKRHDLRGVPGFYYSQYGHWELAGKSGILIPICDKDGYIQGLQIRLDNADRKKYRWLSSNPDYGYAYGAASSVWVHVTGDRGSMECELTEGALKGDIASELSGDRLFVCTPGAGSIQFIAETLRSMGIKKAGGCYDMDKVTEYADLVQQRLENPLDTEAAKPCPLERMESVIQSLGIAYERRVWNPALNGIDDYYLNCLKQRQTAA